MKTPIANLLLPSVLFVILCSSVQSDNQVTIDSFDVDIVSDDIISSWSNDLANNLLASTINVKTGCPNLIEMDTQFFQGDQLVNQIVKQLDKPMKDFESYGICGMLDYPEPDDESCTIAEGEQSAKDCDISSWFTDLSPGKYTVITDFKQNNNKAVTAKIGLTVESG